jgi:DNA repair protein RecO (recombination protein O)
VKFELHPCYILHRRSYRETSFILDVFSSKEGRVSLVAKGVKNRKSPAQGLLQTHQKLLIAWSGKGEMGTLTDVEMETYDIKLSGKCLLSGFYLNELLLRVLHPHEPYPELFKFYGEALIALSEGHEEIALRSFEKNLVDSLGYGLILDHEINTGDKINEQMSYYYQYEQGPSLTRPENNNYLKISGKTLNAIRQNRFDDDTILKEARRLLQPVIKQHIGQKPLQSRELYKAYLESTRQ